MNLRENPSKSIFLGHSVDYKICCGTPGFDKAVVDDASVATLKRIPHSLGSETD